MLTIRLRTLVLLACLFESVWLLIAQAVGNAVLLIPCLVCFLLLAAWSAIKGMALPVILFFLPFAALLKTQPGETSFFTVTLLVVYLICAVLGHRRISILHVIPGALLIGLCLFVKTLFGYEIDNSFILFAVSMLLVPFVSIEFGKSYDFFWLTMFFTIGIALAAISSLYLTEFASIARYIESYEFLGVVRHSGYYGDPNFYSAHVSAALAGVIILLLNNTGKRKMVLLILMMLLLTYCGFLAVSKTFFLIAAAVLLLFFLELMFKKGKLSIKLLLLLTFVVGILFLLSYTAFSELVDMILSRFARDSNISDLTTGRTDIWLKFLRAFEEDTLLLMLGSGYTNVMLIEKASHNTAIQAIYQFGIVGCALLAFWIVHHLRVCLSDVKVRWSYFPQICIILIGTIGPWMALDILFSDEFFLLPMYLCIGIAAIVEGGQARSSGGR